MTVALKSGHRECIPPKLSSFLMFTTALCRPWAYIARTTPIHTQTRRAVVIKGNKSNQKQMTKGCAFF